MEKARVGNRRKRLKRIKYEYFHSAIQTTVVSIWFFFTFLEPHPPGFFLFFFSVTFFPFTDSNDSYFSLAVLWQTLLMNPSLIDRISVIRAITCSYNSFSDEIHLLNQCFSMCKLQSTWESITWDVC